MREATRRQILADMGIPVWHLRGDASPAERDVSTGPVEADSAQKADARAPAAARDPRIAVAVEPRQRRPQSATAAPVPATGATAPGRHGTASRTEAPWSVLSLAVGGTVMLVDGDSSRRDLRLAQDVLFAAAGDWQSRPASRRFSWPPPVTTDGAAPAADAGRRALAAFAAKDLEDHRAVLLLCEGQVAARLGEVRAGCRCLELPALRELGRDSGAKRRLWQTIREARG